MYSTVTAMHTEICTRKKGTKLEGSGMPSFLFRILPFRLHYSKPETDPAVNVDSRDS